MHNEKEFRVLETQEESEGESKVLKKIIGILLSAVLVLGLVGCKTTKKDFVSTVEHYQIFNNNSDGMKTVGDFIKKMERFEKESDKNIHIIVHAFWGDEQIKEKDSFIQYLKQNEEFVFDEKKYYGDLDVSVIMYSPDDYSTKEAYTYHYLFSLDKTGAVNPEAAALCNGEIFNYEEIIGDISLDVENTMESCVLLTEVAKNHYSE